MVNPAFRAIVDRSEQALLGLSCSSSTHQQDVNENLRLIRHLFEVARMSFFLLISPRVLQRS